MLDEKMIFDLIATFANVTITNNEGNAYQRFPESYKHMTFRVGTSLGVTIGTIDFNSAPNFINPRTFNGTPVKKKANVLLWHATLRGKNVDSNTYVEGVPYIYMNDAGKLVYDKPDDGLSRFVVLQYIIVERL